MEKGFYLARPGDPEAARAIARSQQPSDIAIWLPLGTMGFFGFMALFISLEPSLWVAITVNVAIVGGAIFLVYKFMMPGKGSIEHAIKSGSVIVVDSYLVEAWDLLRTRLGINLTRLERRQALNNLFGVAQELSDKLRHYRELENEPELAGKRLETEAYIRARLLREVRELAAYQQGKQEIEASAAPLELPSVSPEDVDAELALLKQERSEQDDTPLT